MMSEFLLNEELDLRLERIVHVSPEQVFQAWTQPEHLIHWFAPAPWTCPRAEVDLRPGGTFLTVMRGPDGQEFGDPGCILEVIPNERFVFTDALAPSYRPNAQSFFTGIIEMFPHDDGCRYVATAVHGNKEACAQHADMGFLDGWGTCLDQLVAYMSNR